MKTGLQLYTKDGRRWGNAIIKERVGPDAYMLETDFGNTGGPLSEKEIRKGWHTEIPNFGERVTDPEQWRRDRATRIAKSNGAAQPEKHDRSAPADCSPGRSACRHDHAAQKRDGWKYCGWCDEPL